jgi:putative Holliday junction resolvase
MGNYKRVLALDLGDVRIGVAVSDLMRIIANGLETRQRTNEKADLAYFAELVSAQDADTVVVGLPINMDGTEGPRALLARAFGEKLSKVTDARIVFQDERLSTVSAEKALIEADMRRDKRKKVIDKIAAAVILQAYLDKEKNS